MVGVRRVPAILLVCVFSFSLIVPVFFADAESNLPVCCRRGGQHHCAMMAGAMEPSASGPAVDARHAKCPLFPNGRAALSYSGAWLPAAINRIAAFSVSQVSIATKCDVVYRIPLDRSHQKRGPPPMSL